MTRGGDLVHKSAHRYIIDVNWEITRDINKGSINVQLIEYVDITLYTHYSTLIPRQYYAHTSLIQAISYERV